MTMDRDFVEKKIRYREDKLIELMEEILEGSNTAQEMYDQQKDELSFWYEQKRRLDRIEQGLSGGAPTTE